MEIYKSNADLRSFSYLLLKLFKGINKGVKQRTWISKFIIWIDVHYTLLLVQLSILALPKGNSLLKALLSLGKEVPQDNNSEWLNWALALNCHFESMSLFSGDCRWSLWRDGVLPRQKLVYGDTCLCVLLAP